MNPSYSHKLTMDLQMDAIHDSFVEAREAIEFAREDADTTYFEESYKEAQEGTDKVGWRLDTKHLMCACPSQWVSEHICRLVPQS